MTGSRWIGGALVAALLAGWTGSALAEDAAAPPAPGAAAESAPAPAKPMKKKAKADSMAGDWSGTAIQVGHSKGYKVTLRVSGKGIEASYPDLSCMGKLTKVGAKGDSSFYTETITMGALDAASGKGCIDGTVTLIKSGDGYIWGWFGQHDGKPIVAYATLAKVAAPAQ